MRPIVIFYARMNKHKPNMVDTPTTKTFTCIQYLTKVILLVFFNFIKTLHTLY